MTSVLKRPDALKGHPAAELLPRLSDEELDELANDVRERGLLEPIVTYEGMVLDGRNRLSACTKAGVEPAFVEYEGDDPVGYVLARNLVRRHLSKGQRAMVAAKAGRLNGQTVRDIAAVQKVDKIAPKKTLIGHAAFVLTHAPDLADAVIAGTLALDAAYNGARTRKAALDSDERKLDRLAHEAPDLADAVREERLALNEAIVAAAERDRKRAEDQRDARELLVRIVNLAVPDGDVSEAFIDAWAERIGDVQDDLPHRTASAGHLLLALAERIER